MNKLITNEFRRADFCWRVGCGVVGLNKEQSTFVKSLDPEQRFYVTVHTEPLPPSPTSEEGTVRALMHLSHVIKGEYRIIVRKSCIEGQHFVGDRWISVNYVFAGSEEQVEALVRDATKPAPAATPLELWERIKASSELGEEDRKAFCDWLSFCPLCQCVLLCFYSWELQRGVVYESAIDAWVTEHGREPIKEFPKP
jgi:hypothetical protein